MNCIRAALGQGTRAQRVDSITLGRYRVDRRVQFWGEGREPLRRTEYLKIE